MEDGKDKDNAELENIEEDDFDRCSSRCFLYCPINNWSDYANTFFVSDVLNPILMWCWDMEAGG